MENNGRYANKASTRGGARPGAGRKKGSTPRYTIEELLQTFEAKSGQSFSEQLIDNYLMAVSRDDWTGVRDYDKMLLSKVVADRQEIEITEPEDAVAAKRAAFIEAVQRLTDIGQDTK